MGWLGWTLTVIGGGVAFFIFNYFIGNPKFWRLARDNSDAAYALFLALGCLVDKEPEAGSRGFYTGPFRLITSDGAIHVIYIPAEKIDEIQWKMTQVMTTDD